MFLRFLLLGLLLVRPACGGFKDFFSRSLREASGECERSIDRVKDLGTKMQSMAKEDEQLTANLVAVAGEKGVFPKRLQERAQRFTATALARTRLFGEATLKFARHGLDFLANVEPTCREACPALFHPGGRASVALLEIGPIAEPHGTARGVDMRGGGARAPLHGVARVNATLASGRVTAALAREGVEPPAGLSSTEWLGLGLPSAASALLSGPGAAVAALQPTALGAPTPRRRPVDAREVAARDGLWASAGDFESECARYVDALSELLREDEEEGRSFIEYARFIRFSGRAFRRGGIEMVREVSRFTDRNLQLTLAMQREFGETVRTQQALGRTLRHLASEALEVCRDCDLEPTSEVEMLPR